MNSILRVCWEGMCYETSSEETMVEVSVYLYHVPHRPLLDICDMELEVELFQFKAMLMSMMCKESCYGYLASLMKYNKIAREPSGVSLAMNSGYS
jgi:hypothetical protein